jgi:hypothetical protein
MGTYAGLRIETLALAGITEQLERSAAALAIRRGREETFRQVVRPRPHASKTSNNATRLTGKHP